MSEKEEQTLRNAERALDKYLSESETMPESEQSIQRDILWNIIFGMQLIGYSVGRSGDGHYHIRKK